MVVTVTLPSVGEVRGIMCRQAKVKEAYLHAPPGEGKSLPQKGLAGVLQASVDKYAAAHYKNHAVGVFGEGPAFSIVLSSASASEANMWSGAWSSTWEVEEDETCLFLTGRIDVGAHYYESGNIQLCATEGADQEKPVVCHETQGVVQAIEARE